MIVHSCRFLGGAGHFHKGSHMYFRVRCHCGRAPCSKTKEAQSSLKCISTREHIASLTLESTFGALFCQLFDCSVVLVYPTCIIEMKFSTCGFFKFFISCQLS